MVSLVVKLNNPQLFCVFLYLSVVLIYKGAVLFLNSCLLVNWFVQLLFSWVQTHPKLVYLSSKFLYQCLLLWCLRWLWVLISAIGIVLELNLQLDQNLPYVHFAFLWVLSINSIAWFHTFPYRRPCQSWLYSTVQSFLWYVFLLFPIEPQTRIQFSTSTVSQTTFGLLSVKSCFLIIMKRNTFEDVDFLLLLIYLILYRLDTSRVLA